MSRSLRIAGCRIELLTLAYETTMRATSLIPHDMLFIKELLKSKKRFVSKGVFADYESAMNLLILLLSF